MLYWKISKYSISIMKQIVKVLAIAAIAVSAMSCSKARIDNMNKIDGIIYECTPEVLAAVAGKVPVTVEVTYPKGYFDPKATLVVTPVLVYEGGEAAAESFVYQGSKVKDNYKVVSKDGGRVRESFSFDLVDGMEVAHLELRGTAFAGKKTVEIPAVKIADGVNTTYKLVDASGEYSLKADGFKDVITVTTEGQILYDVNSATVKNKELRSDSIKKLQEALKEMKTNERMSVKGTEIVAYASPEGGEKFNAKLSDKRAGTAEKAWSKISKGMDADEVVIKSIGQDWEGFKEAVAASDIEDKDLILRVLSMYSDPAVRESEIRNMSQIFTELKDKVFPDLRRARFITTGEYVNYSDAELLALAEEHLGSLDEVSILHAATLTKDLEGKEILYRYAAEKFGSKVANYDLAVLALNAFKSDAAEKYIAAAGTPDADILNLQGVIAMRKGDIDKAMALFQKSGTKDARTNMGTLDILMGKYEQAARELKDGSSPKNEAIAYLLLGDADKAAATVKCHCASSDYIRAIAAARKGDKEGVDKWLASVSKKSAKLAERAAKDIEFANFR